MSYIELQTIDKKIAQTEAEIKNCPTSEIGTMISKELNRRLQTLKEERCELALAHAKDSISLRLHGDAIATGKISNRILISALNGFQQMIDSIANAIHNTSTKRGKMPDAIKEITDFQVVGFFPGSFGITLEKEHEQFSINSDGSKLNIVLDEFFNILETADDSDALLTQISPFGQRTVKHYRDWLKEMQDNLVDLDIDWKDDSAHSRKFKIKKNLSTKIVSTLDSIEKIDNDEVHLIGIINGVNVRNHTFEMSIEGIGIIKGTALLETLIAASEKLGKEVHASLIRSTSYTKTNSTKTTWYLSEVE